MKIQGNNQLPEVREPTLRQTVEKSESEKASVPQDDSVRISSGAKEAQKIMTEIEKVPDVREDRVRELKAAIDAGTYNVSGEAVAEKMIKEFMLETII